MECYSFSKPGADHLEAGQKGQDQMFGIHGADHLALCLCDGCGSSPLGGEAAQYTAMMTARLFYYEFYDLLLARPDAVRRRLSAVLQPALRTIASQLGAPPEALATTILAFAADNSGRYLCAHLGRQRFGDLVPVLRGRDACDRPDDERRHDAASEGLPVPSAHEREIPSAH